MRIVSFTCKAVVAAAVAVGGVYLYNPEIISNLWEETELALGLKEPVLDSYIGKNLTGTDWADPEALQDKVEQEINAALPSTDTASVRSFVQDPHNRLLLAQWMLAQCEINSSEQYRKDEDNRSKNIEKLKSEIEELKAGRPAADSRRGVQLKNKLAALKKAENEALHPHSMLEAVTTAGAGKLMEQMGNNLDWVGQMVWTGDCNRPGTILAIMSDIIRKHPEVVYNQVDRDTVTAVAVEFAKAGWQHDEALARADYFLKSRKDRRLNTVFDTLPFWQRRMAVGCKGDNDFGSPESLQWFLDNVHLPAEQYSGCCWRCGYKLYNLYGDSIQGPHYGTPFNDEYGRNKAKFTYEVGGVCGYLSHFGAFAACANGIPALTCGEPGHCAFIVLVGDKWTPSYSLSWKRGLHWRVWGEVDKFSALHMATKCFSEGEREKTRISDAYRVLAGMRAESDPARARECYAEAVKNQPLNYSAWREYAAFLRERMPGDTEAWKDLNRAACKGLAAEWPEMCAELLQRSVYPKMKEVLDETAMKGEFAAFWRGVRAMGPDRWNIEALMDNQKGMLKETAKTADGLCNLYGDILSGTSELPDYTPIVMAWGNTLSAKMSEEDQKKFLRATMEGISRNTSADAAERDKLLAPAILAAERARDLSTFQALGKMLSPKFTNPGARPPAHTPYPGKLVSQGGMVSMSSTCGRDTPCRHWGLLEPIGGNFETADEKDAWIMVELPRTAYLTGMAIITTSNKMEHMNNMKVQVSETGKDGDWQDVRQLGECKQRVIQLDLSTDKPRAKYVRILRMGGPAPLHLNGIYIYGEQAA